MISDLRHNIHHV